MTLKSSHYLSSIGNIGLDAEELEAAVAGQDGVFRIDAGNHSPARVYVANSMWDTDVLMRKTWTVQSLFWDIEQETAPQLQAVAKRLRECAQDNHVHFMTVRFGADQIAAVQIFQGAGWQLVDTLAVFQAQNATGKGMIAKDVRNLVSEDATDIRRIASTSFSQGRIYADIHLDGELKTAFYNRMAQSMSAKALRGEGGLARVAVSDSGIQGFYLSDHDVLISTVLGRRYGYLSLIATDPDCHKLGVGRKLLADFLAKSRDLYDVTEVSTQLSNFPALALYGSMGIPVCGGIYSMHLHLD